MGFRKKICIVGVGETKVGKLPGRDSITIGAEAAKLALEDAGLKNTDIDAVYVKGLMDEPEFMYSVHFFEYMGMRPKLTSVMDLGGASPLGMLAHAAAAIDAGLADVAICVEGENDATFQPRQQGVGMTRVNEEALGIYGCVAAPISYAMVARRHMHKYGTTGEQMAAVAVAMRKHAVLNENAQMHTPITVEDVMNSRWIAEPLHLLDCCLVSDGGGAFIVTTEEIARNCRKKPVYVLGISGQQTHSSLSQLADINAVGAFDAAPRVWEMSGLGPKDMDLAQIYDCFTITVMEQLEAYGFCGRGESGPYVEGGRIELGGELPVNTHGGLLSQAHIDGMLHVTEAVRQLRGECGARQVPNAKLELVTGNGGILSTHMGAVFAV